MDTLYVNHWDLEIHYKVIDLKSSPFNSKFKVTTDVCGNKKPHSHNNVAAAAEVLDKLVKLCPAMGLIFGGRHSGSNAYNNDTNQDNTRWNKS